MHYVLMGADRSISEDINAILTLSDFISAARAFGTAKERVAKEEYFVRYFCLSLTVHSVDKGRPL